MWEKNMSVDGLVLARQGLCRLNILVLEWVFSWGMFDGLLLARHGLFRLTVTVPVLAWVFPSWGGKTSLDGLVLARQRLFRHTILVLLRYFLDGRC